MFSSWKGELKCKHGGNHLFLSVYLVPSLARQHSVFVFFFLQKVTRLTSVEESVL